MRRKGNGGGLPIWILHSFMFTWFTFSALAEDPELGSSRVVFQTNYGDIEFGFYPTVAPQTVNHIFKLVRLGCYNTNHFFRVDKGFVAQVADVVGGRTAPMNEEQRVEGEKKVVGEFSDVKHVRGILSMGRYSDPNSAQSSFSMLLGDAPHLDGQYAIFGKVTKGDETLRKLEELPTRREGIFVMPTERITIVSSYYYASCDRNETVMVGMHGSFQICSVISQYGHPFLCRILQLNEEHSCKGPSEIQIKLHSDQVKADCYGKFQAEESDEAACMPSNSDLHEWGQSNLMDTIPKAGSSSSQAFSSRSLHPSSRILSCFNFIPGNVSFRLSRATSLGSSR